VLGANTTWLSDMATSFPWLNWTPSFALVRERVMGLTIRAGWAAAAFGEPVVEKYLKVLGDRRALLQRFDAALGLTAIALRQPRLRFEILRDVQSALAREQASDQETRAVLEALLRSVIVALTLPDRAIRETCARGARLIARRAPKTQRALVSSGMSSASIELIAAIEEERDGADIDEQGMFPAILALAACVRSPADAFYWPRQAAQAIGNRWHPGKARGALRLARAQSVPSGATVH